MNIDDAGRGHTQLASGRGPAVGRIQPLLIAALHHVHRPFHPGEIHAPGFAHLWRQAGRVAFVFTAFPQGKPGNDKLQRPEAVIGLGAVKLPFDVYRAFQPMDILADNAANTIAGRLFHQ